MSRFSVTYSLSEIILELIVINIELAFTLAPETAHST